MDIAATYKLLLIGNSSVGKSSFLLRFSEDNFQSEGETSATIGVDFKVKLYKHLGKTYKLNIWDTAGQERFRTLTSSYYRNTQGCFILYDISNRKTFDNVDTWFRELNNFTNDNKIATILIANKTDQQSSRQVTYEEGKQLADLHGVMFMECSAKSNQNIEEAVNILVTKVFNKIKIDNSNTRTK